MSSLDRRELAGGIFITILGVAFAGYAASHYAIGHITRMGPGMVPVALGVLLALFGLAIIAGAWFSSPSREEIRLFIPSVILGSVLAFAVLIGPFGLMPAVFVCVVVATFAEERIRPMLSLFLAFVLCVIAWLIFIVALQLPTPLFNWPF